MCLLEDADGGFSLWPGRETISKQLRNIQHVALGITNSDCIEVLEGNQIFCMESRFVVTYLSFRLAEMRVTYRAFLGTAVSHAGS